MENETVVIPNDLFFKFVLSQLNEEQLLPRQLAILAIVCRMEPFVHTVRGLSKLLSISKPAVTRAVDRLVQLNFVNRVTNEKDRRSVLISPTHAGRVFLQKRIDFFKTNDGKHDD